MSSASLVNLSSIRKKIRDASFEEKSQLLAALAQELSNDPRKTASELLRTAERAYAKERAERSRVQDMYRFQAALAPEFSRSIGIDEVGRGPLAGPLTVCAVSLPESEYIWGINDSKKLSPKKREELAQEIKTRALSCQLFFVEPSYIDEHGMAFSLRFAMRHLIQETEKTRALTTILIDGCPVHVDPREKAIVKGDAQVAAIAAASIVAKVARDELMRSYDTIYPEYHFAENKGYGSAEHQRAIRTYGLSPIHRKSFCKNFIT